MSNLTLLETILHGTLIAAIPLMIVAIGAMFSERGGVINIALEGIMVFGAFSGILFMYYMGNILSGQVLLIAGLLVAGLAGAALSFLHAFTSIRFNADQIISATALNIFAGAFVIFVARVLTGTQQIPIDGKFAFSVPYLKDIPVIGAMFFENAYITTYIGLITVVVGAIVVFKTRFGLRLRACGEYPQAADSAGINVKKMRYIGVLTSGFLGGIGGMAFIIPNSAFFNATVAGLGFLALAVLIFGQWKPYRILMASLFFALFSTISIVYYEVPVIKDWTIDKDWYKMIPYVATLVFLALGSKKSQAPKAAGEAYDKGKR